MKKSKKKIRRRKREEKVSEMTLGGQTGGPSSNVTMGPSRR